MIDLKSLPSAQVDRLRYIEFCLRFLGAFSRADLIDKYGIGTAAASRDIAEYKRNVPQNISKSSNAKKYTLSDNWEPLFDFKSTEVLSQLTGKTVEITGRSYIPNDILDVIDEPNLNIVADLSLAILRSKAIEVQYYSNTSGFSEKILIPHAFVHNGSRWHVRAFDRTKDRFADFVISRFKNVEATEININSHELQSEDQQWNRKVELEIIPHPDIEDPSGIINEFNMEDGLLRKTVRASSVGYFLQKLNVDCSQIPPKEELYCRLKLKNRLALYGVEGLRIVKSFDGFTD